ncbi:MAG: zf-HC2 domain-containing protein [Armatimonadetes bacterium]|nr:zf-HC2 domain-containing protein [Armatimonadota bacterium]
MKPLNCEEAFARLDDFIDRELSPVEQQLVQEHLNVCAHCLAEYKFEAAIVDGIKEKMRKMQVPQELSARLGRALDSA